MRSVLNNRAPLDKHAASRGLAASAAARDTHRAVRLGEHQDVVVLDGVVDERLGVGHGLGGCGGGE